MPGFEAPVNLMYSARNRSAICRIPVLLQQSQGQAGRVPRSGSDRQPVPGVRRNAHGGTRRDQAEIEPPAPIDEDLYEIHDDRKKLIKQVPGSLTEAMDALEKDHEFLLAGDVFTPDVLDTWVGIKRKDVAAVNLRPHPYEFFMYYDA